MTPALVTELKRLKIGSAFNAYGSHVFGLACMEDRKKRPVNDKPRRKPATPKRKARKGE